MNFVALDFETANANMSTICQIGAVTFERGQPVTRLTTLVDPEDFFDGMNISIHGIDEEAVRGAPTFPQVFDSLSRALFGQIVVSHTHFDRVALLQATAKYKLPPITCRWLDSAKVARRTWTECAKVGYGLKPIAERLGIVFQHHDASADAEACGRVLIHAMVESGIDIEGWIRKTALPLSEAVHGPLKREGNPAGILYGECIVFTGALQIPRHQAAAIAADAGCTVAVSVSKKVSILVVGDQDITKLRPGESRSLKHRLADGLIAEGHSMRILGESDFVALCAI